jgi:hypothetical protein
VNNVQRLDVDLHDVLDLQRRRLPETKRDHDLVPLGLPSLLLGGHFALDGFGDLSEFSVHGGAYDDGPSTTLGDLRSSVYHTETISDGHVGLFRNVRVLRDRQGFTGQEGFVGLKVGDGTFEETTVGGDDGSGGHEHDITGHDLFGLDLDLLASSKTHSDGGADAGKSGDGLFGFPFLRNTNKSL